MTPWHILPPNLQYMLWAGCFPCMLLFMIRGVATAAGHTTLP